MSWIARSFANTLRINDDENDDQNNNYDHHHHHDEDDDNDDVWGEEEREGGHGGVKEDLTEFKESLTRQLWGVANFLAPPPPPPPPPPPSSQSQPQPSTSNRANSEDGEENDDEVVEVEEEDWVSGTAGLTDEVLAFAGNIAHHPETWLDYPFDEDEDFDDFPMSESQKRHIHAVEQLTPRLAALRIELCPAHMSSGFFWKVYFVLLHSRLNKLDADLLSTPEVVEARAMWMQELQKRAKKESESYHVAHYFRGSVDLDEDFTPRSLNNEHSETLSSWTFASEPTTSSTTAGSDTSDNEKPVVCSEMQFVHKSTIDEKMLGETDYRTLATPVSKSHIVTFDDDEDDDDWPEDDCLGQDATVITVGLDEDVSFSDLEDDDDCCVPVKSKVESRV